MEELPPIEAHVPKPEPIEPEPLDEPPELPVREPEPPRVPDDRREPVPPEIPEPLPPRPPVDPPPPAEPVPPKHLAKPPEEHKAPRKAAEPPLPPSAGSERATVRARPDCVHNPPPAYPRAARRRGYEGLVLLLVRVSAAGVSLSVEVKESSGHPVLDRAAVKAVQRWRFKPATADGKPTAGEVEVPIRFKLTD